MKRRSFIGALGNTSLMLLAGSLTETKAFSNKKNKSVLNF